MHSELTLLTSKMYYLYSSLNPYEKTMSGYSSKTAVAHKFIKFKALPSTGFSNS